MDENSERTTTRRGVLSAVGTGLALGATATGGVSAAGRATTGTAEARQDAEYVLEQGGQCVPIQPVRGQLTVETFYEYQLPSNRVLDENGAVAGSTARYASLGTRDLQRAQTSIALLYRGPKGLSLVFVHGSIDNPDGGAVSFRLTGLPGDGEWAVKDDLYLNPETGDIASSNYDRWQVDGGTHRIDWTWGSAGTDGGAFRDLGDEFSVTIDPRFNESAALYGEHYEGTVTDWEFLSGSAGVSERISLDLDEPIRIRSGGCGGGEGEERDDEKGEGNDEGEGRDEKNGEGEDNGKGNDEGEGHGKGEGHGNGRGKGHEKGRGKGHEKHDEEEEEEEKEEEEKEEEEEEEDD